MAASTKPPDTCITGSEMPKNLMIAAPAISISIRNTDVLMATRLASRRYTVGGAGPINPRKTSASPSGLISGSNAENESPKNASRAFMTWQSSRNTRPTGFQRNAGGMTIDLSDSPCVAKLDVNTPVVPGALCVLEIHEHALHGLDHEVQACANRRIDVLVERAGPSPFNAAAPENSLAPHRSLNDRRSSTFDRGHKRREVLTEPRAAKG